MSNFAGANQPGSPEFEARRKKTLDVVREFDRQARLRPNELRHELLPTLQKMLGHAVNNSAWWRDRLKSVTPHLRDAANFQELLDLLPITSHRDLQENSGWMAAWVAGSNPEMFSIRTLAQTQGQPIRMVYFNPEYAIRNQAAQLLSATWSKRDYGRPLISYGPRELPAAAETQGTPMAYLGKVGSVRTFNSRETSAAQFLDALADTKSAVAQVAQAELQTISDEQASNPRRLRLEQLVVIGGVIDAPRREQLKKTFGCRVINLFDSDYFGVIAIECQVGDHLHPLNFHNYIEVLDENNRRPEVGQRGRIVLTSLSNPALPIFRYELGLSAEIGSVCAKELGLPTLKF